MSFALDIHLWPSSDEGREIDTFRSILDCIPAPDDASNPESLSRRYHRIVIDSHSSKIVDEELKSANVEDFSEILERHWSNGVHINVEASYNCLEYDDVYDRLSSVARPLDIHFYGNEYVSGSYYKRYGPVRIAFFNTNSFLIPQSLINKVQKAQAQRQDAVKWLIMIAQMSQNFSTVKHLARNIISRINPDHLVICTESEVHPLTSHGIYHRIWPEFFKDLLKIATLHEYGGVYFCDARSGDPAFIAPRKFSLDYGYMRGNFGDRSNNLFAEKVQLMADVILQNPDAIRPTKDLLEECFILMCNTDVEEINDSYLLFVKEAPFAYLEEPYFKLYDKIIGGKSST